jgi:hypothetical protein
VGHYSIKMNLTVILSIQILSKSILANYYLLLVVLCCFAPECSQTLQNSSIFSNSGLDHQHTLRMSHVYYEGHTNEDLLLVEIMFGDIS